MTRTETNEVNLKSQSTITIKGLPGNPTIPEDKGLKAILESVKKCVDVIADFVISTKELYTKRSQAVTAVIALHGHLNDLCRLYTKNVCINRNTEETIDQVKTAVSEVASTCSPSPSYAKIASAAQVLPTSAHVIFMQRIPPWYL
jgi:hypothetical protein